MPAPSPKSRSAPGPVEKFKASMAPDSRQRDPIHVRMADHMLEKEGITPFSKQVESGRFSTQNEADQAALDYNDMVTQRGVFPGSLGPDALASINKARGNSPKRVSDSVRVQPNPSKANLGRVVQKRPGGSSSQPSKSRTPPNWREGQGY